MRKELKKLSPVRDKGNAHPGLLLQRYLVHPADGSNQWSEEKRAILQAAITAATNDDVCNFYRAAFARWSTSLPTDPPPVDLTTTGRLIVGLGSENVLETGIRLHHTYGMPSIPGSALKGLAAHYCDQVWGQADKRFKKPTKIKDKAYRAFLAGNGPQSEANLHRLLFGNTDDGGCITFHDAWLTPDSRKPLVLDVMTPHHPKWNDIENPAAPSDFDSPIPIPFLSVRGIFRVVVSWHGPASDQARKWTELARTLLCDALKEWGVGGKTTSGYGLLVEANAVEAKTTRPKVPADNLVEVTILEAMPKTGLDAFRVQEDGKPKGMLNHGTSPNPRPEIGSKVRVYREPTSQPNNPTYRWSKLEPGGVPKPQARHNRGKR